MITFVKHPRHYDLRLLPLPLLSKDKTFHSNLRSDIESLLTRLAVSVLKAQDRNIAVAITQTEAETVQPLRQQETTS